MCNVSDTLHIPVLLAECTKALTGGNKLPGNESGIERYYLDCTFGGGGHTTALLEDDFAAKVIAIDRDPLAVTKGAALLTKFAPRLTLIKGKFSDSSSLLESHGFKNLRFDGVLADLGFSTDQLKSDRGFSLRDEVGLDMRMGESEFTAKEIVNTWSYRDLKRIFQEGGATKEAHLAATIIINGRPFTTAFELASTLEMPLIAKRGYRSGGTHPATVIFQALRIAVNREFIELQSLLDQLPGLITSKGRVAIIAFHSLEDEIVAKRFRSWAEGDTTPARWRGSDTRKKALGIHLTKKAITAGEIEVAQNAASRSARLRVFEFF
jgi:16S rRNA (cytosine1402-N4)-methyltransferase